MDTLIRFNRMEGHNTLWQAGTDHAGIATQMVVERKIAAEEGKTRHDYGREAFINKNLGLESLFWWHNQPTNAPFRELYRLGT